MARVRLSLRVRVRVRARARAKARARVSVANHVAAHARRGATPCTARLARLADPSPG